jgi:hypothetical protein
LSVLAVWSFLSRGFFIYGSDYPLSWDGFFYLQGLKHFITTGEHYYSVHELFISFWGSIARWSGLNEVAVYYVSMMWSLLIIGAALAIIAWLFGMKGQALTFPVIVWASNTLFHQVYGSTSEVFAVGLFALSFLCFVLPSTKTGTSVLFESVATLFLLLACSAHLFTSILACALYLPLIQFRAKRISAWHWVVWAIVIAVCVFHFSVNPKSVFSRFNLFDAGNAVFASHRAYFRPYQAQEFVFFAAISILLGVLMYRRHAGTLLGWSLLALLGAFLSPMWISFWNDAAKSGSLSDRVCQAAPLIFPFFLVVALQSERMTAWRKPVLLLCALFLFSQRLYFRLDAASLGPPMSVGAISNRADILRAWIPTEAPVLTMHGIQFRVTYFLGNPSSRPRSNRIKSGESFSILQSDKLCPDIDALNATSIGRFNCVSLGEGWIVHRTQSRP